MIQAKYVREFSRILAMIFVQAGPCAIIGTGLGLGACAIGGQLISDDVVYASHRRTDGFVGKRRICRG